MLNPDTAVKNERKLDFACHHFFLWHSAHLLLFLRFLLILKIAFSLFLGEGAAESFAFTSIFVFHRCADSGYKIGVLTLLN